MIRMVPGINRLNTCHNRGVWSTIASLYYDSRFVRYEPWKQGTYPRKYEDDGRWNWWGQYKSLKCHDKNILLHTELVKRSSRNRKLDSSVEEKSVYWHCGVWTASAKTGRMRTACRQQLSRQKLRQRRHRFEGQVDLRLVLSHCRELQRSLEANTALPCLLLLFWIPIFAFFPFSVPGSCTLPRLL